MTSLWKYLLLCLLGVVAFSWTSCAVGVGYDDADYYAYPHSYYAEPYYYGYYGHEPRWREHHAFRRNHEERERAEHRRHEEREHER